MTIHCRNCIICGMKDDDSQTPARSLCCVVNFENSHKFFVGIRNSRKEKQRQSWTGYCRIHK